MDTILVSYRQNVKEGGRARPQPIRPGLMIGARRICKPAVGRDTFQERSDHYK